MITATQSLSQHVRELAGLDLADAKPPFLRVTVAREVAVVLSRSRPPAREVALDRCAADNVPVVVRPSGGGAVVVAPGVVVASVLHRSPRTALVLQPHFDRFCDAVARAIVDCGAAQVNRRGVSDICLGSRKVAGSSLRIAGERVLFQVSLLVDPEISLLERYLRAPSLAPAYRCGRSHREFVVTLRDAGLKVSRGAAAGALTTALSAAVG